MLSKVSSLVLLFVCSAGAQNASTDKPSTIERVKKLRASSLDHGLPDVTLEFFLSTKGKARRFSGE